MSIHDGRAHIPFYPLLQLVFLWACFSCVRASDFGTHEFMTQSFFFNYATNGVAIALPAPVTAQCDTVELIWSRGNAVGPNPTAPYFLQIYTSAFVFPFIVAAGSGLSFDWTVPFAPNTQYQICMFDMYGNSGGCQATYTMIEAENTTVASSCANMSFPLGPLDIEATVWNGPLSQYGWVDTCTDISVLPKNGTPPYTFTVAPALHPPYNITTSNMTAMNWTVALSWASPFFISVTDADGNFWANGPLHSGDSSAASTSCLNIDASSTISDVPSSTSTIKPAAAIGAGIGGLIAGLLAGVGSTLFLQRHRARGRPNSSAMELTKPYSHPQSLRNYSTRHLSNSNGGSSHYLPVPASGHHLDTSNGSTNSNTLLISTGANPYQIEPFILPGEMGTLHRESSYHDHDHDHDSTIPIASGSGSGSGSGSARAGSSPPISPQHERNQVYVVHHDGGRPPVTVYTAQGTEVVELPPRYVEGSSSERDSSGLSNSIRPSESRSQGLPEGQQTDSSNSNSNSGSVPIPPFLEQPRRPGPRRKKRGGSSSGQPQPSSS